MTTWNRQGGCSWGTPFNDQSLWKKFCWGLRESHGMRFAKESKPKDRARQKMGGVVLVH